MKIDLITDISKLNKTIFNNIKEEESLNLKNIANKMLYIAKTVHKYKNISGNLTNNTIIEEINNNNNEISYSLSNKSVYSIYVINKTKDNFLLNALNLGGK